MEYDPGSGVKSLVGAAGKSLIIIHTIFLYIIHIHAHTHTVSIVTKLTFLLLIWGAAGTPTKIMLKFNLTQNGVIVDPSS